MLLLSSQALFQTRTSCLAVGCEEGWQEDNQFRDLMGEEVVSFITAEVKDVQYLKIMMVR